MCQAPGVSSAETTDHPMLELGDGSHVNPASVGRKCVRAATLEGLASNIRGSGQHIVRGRAAPAGHVLGHEITGEALKVGSDLEFTQVGDTVSLPFKIALGRCGNCTEGRTGIWLNVNSGRYSRQLPMAILRGKVQIARTTTATPIAVEDALQVYRDFDSGASRRYLLEPECELAKLAA
jgi:hypothetical protein